MSENILPPCVFSDLPETSLALSRCHMENDGFEYWYPGFDPHYMTTGKIRKEIDVWCKKNLSGKIAVLQQQGISHSMYDPSREFAVFRAIIKFKNVEDLILFKLRW